MTTLAKSPIFRGSVTHLVAARFSDPRPGNYPPLAGPCFLQGGDGSSGFPREGREMWEGRAQKPVYFPSKPNKPSLFRRRPRWLPVRTGTIQAWEGHESETRLQLHRWRPAQRAAKSGSFCRDQSITGTNSSVNSHAWKCYLGSLGWMICLLWDSRNAPFCFNQGLFQFLESLGARHNAGCWSFRDEDSRASAPENLASENVSVEFDGSPDKVFSRVTEVVPCFLPVKPPTPRSHRHHIQCWKVFLAMI